MMKIFSKAWKFAAAFVAILLALIVASKFYGKKLYQYGDKFVVFRASDGSHITDPTTASAEYGSDWMSEIKVYTLPSAGVEQNSDLSDKKWSYLKMIWTF